MLSYTFHVGTSWISKIIQMVTRSRVTHVEQCMNIDTMAGYGIDVGSKLGILPISRTKKGTRVCVVEVVATEEQIAAVAKAKASLDGKSYDYFGIFGFLMNKEKYNKDSRWYCSEVEAYGLMEAGLNPFRDKSVSYKMVSPKMLFTSSIFVNPKWGTVQKDGTVVWDR